VRDGQTSPHKPRLVVVVSHSTCPSPSPPPITNSFILGTEVININNSPHVHWCVIGRLYTQSVRVYYPPHRTRKALRVFCLLVLNSVTSTPQWIRQPKPRNRYCSNTQQQRGGLHTQAATGMPSQLMTSSVFGARPSPRFEAQSRTRGGKSGGLADQPQHRRP